MNWNNILQFRILFIFTSQLPQCLDFQESIYQAWLTTFKILNSKQLLKLPLAYFLLV